jgi:hypothetical protein
MFAGIYISRLRSGKVLVAPDAAEPVVLEDAP